MNEQKLLQLLKRKQGFFEAILDLTLQETELALDEWISHLEQKKVLLSCIEEIDQEIGPYKAAFAELSQEIDEALSELREIIRDILQQDAHNFEKRRKQYGHS